MEEYTILYTYWLVSLASASPATAKARGLELFLDSNSYSVSLCWQTVTKSWRIRILKLAEKTIIPW